jgi:CubicO group peptidase (beta-lactamase class C family)
VSAVLTSVPSVVAVLMASEAARQLILDAIARRVFPAASIEVGASGGVLWREALGTLTFEDPSRPALEDTPFDLASLTKPIATTSIVMRLVYDGRLRLDDPVAQYFPEWRGRDREAVTVEDLLEHASGLAARLVDAPPAGRREFEHDICAMRLEYEPRTRSVYSDLGFILLGFLAADLGGATLADQWDLIATGEIAFNVPSNRRLLAAPTRPMDDDARRGRLLAGEVHDNYAAALGGAAGHAGLFGTAAGVGEFARTVLRAVRGDASIPPPLSPALVSRAVTRSAVPGSSRALGWDTMLPTSSCGTRMSPSAFGHVGFTGTSLWIDPARDRYFVLLTNRACGGGTLEQMRAVRIAFHDAAGLTR